jgi:hypothetical protein
LSFYVAEDQFDRKSRKRLAGLIIPEGVGAIFGESEKQIYRTAGLGAERRQQNTVLRHAPTPRREGRGRGAPRALALTPARNLPRGLARARRPALLHRYARVPLPLPSPFSLFF